MTTRISTLIARLEDEYSQKAAHIAQSAQDMGASIDQAAKSVDGSNEGLRRTAQTTAQFVQSMDGVQKATNRTEAAFSRLEQRLERARADLAQGKITQQQYNDIVATQTVTFEKVEAASKKTIDALRARGAALASDAGATKASNLALAEGTAVAKLSSYQIGILAGEAHKFADQVLAGGGAMKAAFYQVPNMVTVMGGFGKATQIVGGLLMGPVGLAALAVAAGAAIYKMGSAAETEESHLAALGQTLRATRSDYAAMAGAAEDAARRISGKSGLSLDDSRSVTSTFAAVPSVSGGNLDALATTARNLATVLGKDVPDAAKEMTAAFADPAKAAEDFAQKGLLGVHEGLVQQIRDMQTSGDRLGAWNLLMGQIGKATANAADQGVTPFHRALHEMNVSLHESFAPLGQFVDWLGEGIAAGALKAVQGIQAVLEKAKEIRAWEFAQIDKIPAVHDYFQRREVAASDVAGVGKTIDSVGASLGANNDVIALAHRIQPIESATGQYDTQGRVVQSSAGALGAMQIMPGNANGNDLRTTTGNVTAGVQLLTRLYAKYDGNQALVAMAYNWGEGNVDQYLSGKIARPPESVMDYAQKATGGEVYGAQATASRQSRVDDQLRGNDGSIAAQIREREEAITALTTAQKSLNELHSAGKVSDAEYAAQTGVLTDKVNAQRGAINELRDPLQTLAHQQTLAAESARTYSAAEASMVQVRQQVEEAARRMGQEHATAAQLADAETRQQAILTNQFNQSVAAINERTQAEQDLLAGYDASKGSLTQYQQAMEAAEKVRATSIGGTAEQARQLIILTGSMKAATASQVDMADAGKLYGQSLDLEVIKAQTAAIGQNSDAVSVQIAVLKERNRILKEGGNVNSETNRAYLDNVAAIQTATNAYQHQKSAMDELTGSMKSIFSTMTNSVTQAFVQGGKGAVSFGSILSGLQTQVVGLVAKLGLMNPAMNALDGKGRETFSSLSDALASGGSVGGAAGKAGSVSIPGAGTATSSVASSSSWLSSAMGTKLFGTATVGNMLGGIGGGFGLGSALGNIGGGTYGLLGAGGGALLGAGLGSIIPGIGTLLGGLIGGGAGGLLGGLFGHKKNPYTIDQVLLEGDEFKMGKSWNQKQTDTITAQLKSELASLNTMMTSLGLKADNAYLGTVRDDPNNKDPDQRSVSLKDLLGGVKLRSDGNATFTQALAQGMPASFDSVASFQSAVTQLKAMADTVDALHVAVSKFNSDGTVTVSGFTEATGDLRTALDHMLNGKTVSTSDLQSQVATITEFVSNTMPNLMKATVNGQQSWVEQMEALKKTYADAASQAGAYGLDGNALNNKFSALYAQGYDQNMRSLTESGQSVKARLLAAQGNQQGADLMDFDLSATQQRRQLAESWKGFLGESYAGNQTYLQQATDLDRTLAAERLAIQKQYADKAVETAKQERDQAANSAASVVSNLLDFAKGLSTSSYSPLSAEAQYRAANDNFNTLANKAGQGDYEALQSMRSAAEALLAQSQIYNGSGQDYAADYTRIQQMLLTVGNSKPEVLTASAMKAIETDSTRTLVASLNELRELMNKQLAEQRHQAQGKAA